MHLLIPIGLSVVFIIFSETGWLWKLLGGIVILGISLYISERVMAMKERKRMTNLYFKYDLDAEKIESIYSILLDAGLGQHVHGEYVAREALNWPKPLELILKALEKSEHLSQSDSSAILAMFENRRFR